MFSSARKSFGRWGAALMATLGLGASLAATSAVPTPKAVRARDRLPKAVQQARIDAAAARREVRGVKRVLEVRRGIGFYMPLKTGEQIAKIHPSWDA